MKRDFICNVLRSEQSVKGKLYVIQFRGYSGECIQEVQRHQIKAQGSGFDLGRRRSGVSELWGLSQSEGYGACVDDMGQ